MKILYRLLALLIYLCFCAISATSVYAEGATRFYHLTSEDGLAHTDVACVVEDSEGFMWFGTSGGLQCYDGYQFRTYDYYDDAQSTTIRGSKNRIITIDECGDFLYVGSNGGLAVFNKIERCYEEIRVEGVDRDKLENEPVLRISSDERGNIWMRMKSDMLVGRYEQSTSTFLIEKRLSDEIPLFEMDQVLSFWGDGDDMMLIYKQSRIERVSLTEGEIVVTDSYDTPSIAGGAGTIVKCCCTNGKIYLKFEKGVVELDIDEQSGRVETTNYKKMMFKDEELFQVTHNRSFVVDSNGNIWSAYKDGIVKISDPFSAEPLYQQYHSSESDMYSLTTQFVSNLYTDSNSNIWVTTWGGGVNYAKTTPSQFNIITKSESDESSINGLFVKAVERDADGYLWIATQNYGVDKYDLTSQRVVATYPAPHMSQEECVIKTLKVSEDSRFVYVSSINGLYVIDTHTRKSEFIDIEVDARKSKYEIPPIFDIDIDRNGNLWLATWLEGVLVIGRDGDNYRLLNKYNTDSKLKLSSNVITSITFRGNKVWISSDKGLNVISLNNLGQPLDNTIYAVDEGNPFTMNNDFVAALAIESDSVAWVGTLGGGLNRLSLQDSYREHQGLKIGDYTSRNFTKSDGLPNNDVEIVVLDNDGNVWMGGGNGVSKLEYPSLKVANYDFIDGLQSNSFKIGTYCKDNEGVIYLGGIRGLNYFDPVQIDSNTDFGKLVLSGFKVHNSQTALENESVYSRFIEYVDELELNYNQSDFTIKFSTLNFYPTNKILFRYKLVGIDEDWKTTTKTYNEASYANLSSGKYTFSLESSYDSGITWDSANQRVLKISIAPPWWWSWWSKSLYLLFVIAVVVFIFVQYNERMNMVHRLEIQSLKERNKEDNHQMKLQFFTNISHEFRTPLTIIISTIEELSSHLPDSKYQQYINTISRSASKMHSLITQLMDFRKTDTQRDVLHTSRETINPYIGEIVQEFVCWSVKRGVKLDYRTSSDITLWFDREKVTKIVWNLISNAIKYSENGSEISITLDRGEYASVKPYYSSQYRVESNPQMGECLLFVVRDSGVGIVEESLSQIFDRYFQVTSNTSIHLGSGIGLAVVKGMVLSHCGNIVVSSSKGEGSEFVVAIPIDASYLSDANKFADSEFDVNQYLKQEFVDDDIESTLSCEVVGLDADRHTILIVEDNLDLLSILVKHFSPNYNVITAKNGKEGLEQYSTHTPDIIISDVMMPVMDGNEMCRLLRENLKTISTPIIMLTAKAELADYIEGLESGADLYLPKPFSVKVLDLHIARLLSYREHSSDKIVEEQPSNNREVATVEHKDDDLIDKLVALLLANLDNSEYTVTSLCTDLGIGRTRLYTRVKDLTGQSLGNIIRDVRLSKAAELLSSSDKNITEVTYEVGIDSVSHFSRVFKQHYGVTPSDYAKGVRKA